jgi:hypothetical protein
VVGFSPWRQRGTWGATTEASERGVEPRVKFLSRWFLNSIVSSIVFKPNRLFEWFGVAFLIEWPFVNGLQRNDFAMVLKDVDGKSAQ